MQSRTLLAETTRSGSPLDATDEEMDTKAQDFVYCDRHMQVNEIPIALGIFR